MRSIDYTGKKFGMLTVIKQEGKDKHGHKLWLCECDCGNFVHKQTGDLGETRAKSCGCLRKRRGSNSSSWGGYGGISGDVWAAIRRGAESRNIPFEITIEEAWYLFDSQGGFCAISNRIITFPENNKGTKTASLDRIDSSKGYTVGNVWWVHKDVNIMKNVFDIEYFVNLCHDISIANAGGVCGI